MRGGSGGVCSLANYSVAYEETQSNRVSDFRGFMCSWFPKATLFDFYLNSRLAIFLGRNCPFGFLLVVFDCVAVTLSACFFPLVSWN